MRSIARVQSRVIALGAVVCAALLTVNAEAQKPGRRRAVIVGINDYSSAPAAPPGKVPSGRDWPDLTGSVTDAREMAEMLVLLYGFERRDIVLLTDRAASREAILRTVEQHLAAPAAKGDVLLFYYAGHGTQVRNSLSDEPDKLDEALVPADSRSGARDIRDKELRPLFNRMLDRGARLTVVLDNCHSGSGARGLPTGARPRSVKADLRDVADRKAGPRPEDRGALVVAAAQDFDAAWETRDEQGNVRGAFSWAWLRAMRDAVAGEPAIDTFLRAQARLRAETPYQEPVLAGNAEARLAPFLGVRTDRRGERTIVAVEKVQADGAVVLQGGWASGLSPGTQLQLQSSALARVRLTVTSIDSLGRSRARVQSPRPGSTPSLASGALLEVVGWAAPAGRPLRLWMPRSSESAAGMASLARDLAGEAAKRGVKWIGDPLDAGRGAVLRWNDGAWELLRPDGRVERAGASGRDAVAAVARLARGSSLFVQLPAPASLVDAIAVGGTDRVGIEPVQHPQQADYILTGRGSNGAVEYAWVRPGVARSDRAAPGLPLRTQWVAQDAHSDARRDSALLLRDAALRLRKIHGWYSLESPPGTRFPYALALRREPGGEIVTGAVAGEEKYSIVLRADRAPRAVAPRYIYIFTIDSHGRSVLLFPRSGSVENRFPLGAEKTPSAEISLGRAALFEAAPPYGVDTYFLLTCDEPLPNPWILEWDGVRRGPESRNALEELLVRTGSGSRSALAIAPSTWSIERVVIESVPPRVRRTRSRGSH